MDHIVSGLFTDSKKAGKAVAELKEQGILAIPFGKAIRMVTHYDSPGEDELTTAIAPMTTSELPSLIRSEALPTPPL